MRKLLSWIGEAGSARPASTEPLSADVEPVGMVESLAFKDKFSVIQRKMTVAAALIAASHHENEIQFHFHHGRRAPAPSVTFITGSCAVGLARSGPSRVEVDGTKGVAFDRLPIF